MMTDDEIDLLSVDRGSVTSPAGCGKTNLIASALRRHDGRKPVLVLTHTNAGVAALRSRLAKLHVPPKAYRLSTVDGWAMSLITMFPVRSGHDPGILRLLNPGTDYQAIRVSAAGLLRSGHIRDSVVATYDRLFVDEYQDCSVQQHEIVTCASESLKTCVLGDPMQAIFGFRGNQLVDWSVDVSARFPPSGALSTPWRWILAESHDLGTWLLGVREALCYGRPVDLASAPSAVRWIRLTGDENRDHLIRQQACQLRPAGNDARVLIIADSRSPPTQQRYACQTPGAVTVEAVDLKDLISFAHGFSLSDTDALPRLIKFAGSMITHVNAAGLVERVGVLTRDRSRNPPTPIESAALSFQQTPSFATTLAFISAAEAADHARVYRPALLRAFVRSLQSCINDPSLTLLSACIRTREQYRSFGRPLPKRGVGSTLLLKGLETEGVVILNADGMDAKNLYVAMTRGSKSLTICSSTQILNPGR